MLNNHAHTPIDFRKLRATLFAMVFGFVLAFVLLQGFGGPSGQSASAGQAPAPTVMEPAQVFDYFPAQYVNQAKYVEQLPAQF